MLSELMNDLLHTSITVVTQKCKSQFYKTNEQNLKLKISKKHILQNKKNKLYNNIWTELKTYYFVKNPQQFEIIVVYWQVCKNISNE